MKVSIKSIFFLSSVVAVLTFYLILSVNIRPIADDYCAAAGSSNGVISYMHILTQTWSGDYLQIFFNGLLVALPLSKGPLFLLGISTLFSYISLLFLFIYLISRKLGLCPLRPSSIAFIAALVLIIWNLYWAFPAAIKWPVNYDRLLDTKETFSGVFGWPTVIVQYLIVPLVIVLVSFARIRRTWLNFPFLILIGLMIGTGGYALALAVTLASCLLLLTYDKRLGLTKTVLLNVGIFSGALISFSSTGAQARSELLASSRDNSSSDSVFRWFSVSSLEFIVSIFNVGVLVVLIAGFVLSQHLDKLFSLNGFKFENKSILRSFGIFLLVYYAIISVSEYFTYNAFWHLITFKSGLFFYFFFLGIFTGKRCKTHLSPISVSKIAMLSSAVALSSCLVVYQTNSNLVERRVAWNVGPAALPGISDISPQDGWVDKCWDKISNQDKYPQRD